MKILTARLNEHKMSESGPKSYLVQLYYYCTYLNYYCKIEEEKRSIKFKKIMHWKKIMYYTSILNTYCCLD